MDLDRVRDAQQAAELRLAAAEIVTCFEAQYDGSEDVTQEMYEEASRELAGPFCGCNTCIIREVLSAAWPHLKIHAVDSFLRTLGTQEFREGVLAGLDQTEAERV